RGAERNAGAAYRLVAGSYADDVAPEVRGKRIFRDRDGVVAVAGDLDGFSMIRRLQGVVTGLCIDSMTNLKYRSERGLDISPRQLFQNIRGFRIDNAEKIIVMRSRLGISSIDCTGGRTLQRDLARVTGAHGMDEIA